ncbi:uncharacterized protein LOC129615656 [Condylostylus longicornis]|uniref:uncharacterized protein LOC129615656 n=1 Tax=Condylostylus longicornis TaxID=2530218 RepID=UPI00244DFA83|nr:uncharacterized protein LOC129615656 [Condylostylus longicornis]
MQQFFLPTANVYVKNTPLRALIDQRSQSSFITKEVANQLQPKRIKIDTIITVIGAKEISSVKSSVSITITSKQCNEFSITTTAYVLENLTKILPQEQVYKDKWEHLKNIELADPEFEKPAKVNLILGSDIFIEILLSGIIKGQSYHPIAQQTVFGWIVTGPGARKTLKKRLICHVTLRDIDAQVKQFWAAEEIPKNEMVKEDEECEVLYKANTQRNNEGRYIARISFREGNIA